MNKWLFKTYQYFKNRKYRYPLNLNNLLVFLLKSQYWNRDKIEELQLNQLNLLLRESKKYAAYYKNSLENIPQTLESLNLFNSKVPFLTKKDIIENINELKSDILQRNYKHTTSGSTGNPMSIEISGLAEVYRKAGVLRFHEWWGINPNDKSVLIWGVKKTKEEASSLFDYLKKALRNRYDINVFDLSPDSIFKFYTEIEKIRPKFIRGYKSALLQFAELLDRANLKFTNFEFKVAIVTSEVLMEDERMYIESILGCRVANEYGSAEAGLFAYECPSGSMHIFEEAVYINTNEQDEVFVTEYFNNNMPLIQYKNDDKVIISEKHCPCGRTSRVIESIEGRINDFILRADGGKISQYLFYYIVKELDDKGFENSILKYKIIQKFNVFLFYIVAGPNFDSKVEQYIRGRMINEIGAGIKITFIKVDKINREKSGKLRFFVREN